MSLTKDDVLKRISPKPGDLQAAGILNRAGTYTAKPVCQQLGLASREPMIDNIHERTTLPRHSHMGNTSICTGYRNRVIVVETPPD